MLTAKIPAWIPARVEPSARAALIARTRLAVVRAANRARRRVLLPLTRALLKARRGYEHVLLPRHHHEHAV